MFSDKIKMIGSPVADQMNSGRCWIFALLNILRIFVAKKHNLGDFQLSQVSDSAWVVVSLANLSLFFSLISLSGTAGTRPTTS